MAGGRVPGVAVAVCDTEQTLFLETLGLADVAARRPVTPDTLFEIGSIGKTFTALVVLQLVEEGRVRLDDPVQRHLPWFEVPMVGRAITIHDLLSHTAGITAGTDGTPEAAFQVWSLRHLTPGSAPGTRYHYSNVGYKALGLVIEAIDGRRYPEAVRARILEPLGMRATEPEIRHATRPHLAVGYEYLFDDRVPYPGQPLVPATWLETDTADGSIASTAGDMAKFARMLLRRGQGPERRIVSEPTFESMRTPHATPEKDYAYGYGLSIRKTGGRMYLGHGGGMVGYLAGLQLDLESGFGAIVLQNGPGLNSLELARTAIAMVRDGREPRDATEEAADTDLLGTYIHVGPANALTIDVVEEAGDLVLRAAGIDARLEPEGDRRFSAHHPAFDEHWIVFGPAEGKAVELWHGERRYVRAGGAAPPEWRADESLLAFGGHFRSHNPWATNFRVLLRGDSLWLTFSAAPDGFDDEQRLIQLAEGEFRAGEDEAIPERIAFDTIVDGRTLRAWLSGFPYYRVA
jgi:CubicO group peptidase (beta-lactamase class C family)